MTGQHNPTAFVSFDFHHHPATTSRMLRSLYTIHTGTMNAAKKFAENLGSKIPKGTLCEVGAVEGGRGC